MKSSTIRSILALGLAVGFLSACDSVMSALDIFLVKFFYGGGGVGSLILPSDIRAAATAYTSCSGGSYSCVTDVAKLSLKSDIASALLTGNTNAFLKSYTDKSKYGVNLAFGLGADNSGNSNPASFPLSAGLNLFVQQKVDANKTTTQLKPFSVRAGKVDTIPVTIPVTVAAVPDASFQSMLKGESIPYWLNGQLGFDLKSPSGEVLSSHQTSMDLATEKISTRPSDATVQGFLNAVSGVIGK